MPDESSAISIGGITCWDEGVREKDRRDGVEATRTLLCHWSDRRALIRKLRPPATLIGGVYAYDADPYPDIPGLLPDEFDAVGVGELSEGPNGMVAHKYARITARYSTLDIEEPDGQGFLSLDFGASILTLPKASVLEYLDTNGDPLASEPKNVPYNENPNWSLTTVAFTVGLRNLGELPVAKIMAAAAKPVSSTPMYGQSAGTVIFDGGRSLRRLMPGADATSLEGVWDLELRFLARPGLPWDYLARKDRNGNVTDFHQVRWKGNQRPFMGRSDLSKLLDKNNLPEGLVGA